MRTVEHNAPPPVRQSLTEEAGVRVWTETVCAHDELALDSGRAKADGVRADVYAPLAAGDVVRVADGGDMVLGDRFLQTGKDHDLNNTVDRPSRVTAEAQQDRLRLLDNVNCVAMGVDAAQTIRPRNSLEKMMMHQAAGAHAAAMKALATAESFRRRAEHLTDTRQTQLATVASLEATRMLNAAARMMTVFQAAALTVQRLRTAGKQTVTVQHIHQHVTVKDGGQAVVAAKVKGAGRGRGGKPK